MCYDPSYLFLDDALEHELLLNHTLLIFKNYLYKTKDNKNLNFNILKNCLTKIRDLEANLKDNNTSNKKWTIISEMLKCFTKNKLKEKV